MKKIGFSFLVLLFLNFLSSAQNQRNSQNNQSSEHLNNINKLGTVYSSITRFYVDETNNSKIVEDAIKGILENLDPHSTYTNAEETRKLNEPLEANFDGIGITFNMLLDTLYITQVHAGGPSQKVGLLAGDRIVKVDDTPIAGVNMANSDIIKLIRGKKGTLVRIFVKRSSSPDLLEFLITRDNISIYSIDACYMADATTGYIRLSRFASTTINEFKTALYRLQKEGMKNLILDLQENGGGYLHIAYALADQFLDSGRLIVYTQGDKMRRSDAISTDDGLFTKGKLVILINEGSASASEIVAGAIQDWDRGVIVGRRSFGKGLVQRSFDLPDSSMIRLTVARYYTPSGRYIQKPYEKGNSYAYKHDLIDRYNKGELLSADSIHFPDSLKYQTLISKRTVYGGGGIMPDIFVPIDSARFTPYHSRLNGMGVIYRFSMRYLDSYRKELQKLYPNFKIFKDKFNISDALLVELQDMGTENNVLFNEDQFNKSKEYLSLQLKALIANALFDNSEYFEIINARSDSFLCALEIINDDDVYFKILK